MGSRCTGFSSCSTTQGWAEESLSRYQVYEKEEQKCDCRRVKTEKTLIITMTMGYMCLIYEEFCQIKSHTNTCDTPIEKGQKS